MLLIPDSTISIYSGVEIDNGEQLVFSSKANQTAYFQSKMVRQVVNCTMNKKTGKFSINVPGSVVSTCNYISFVNPSFDNKTVYARIVDYDYVNNEATEILYAIDYFQTWLFDVEFQPSYIEREHLSEAEWNLAETNPYDPSILEFRTPENLPISKDLEKLVYNIGDGTGQDDDGIKATAAMGSSTEAGSNLGVLIKFNHIDFTKLDLDDEGHLITPVTDRPSYLFSKWLEHIMGDYMGFFSITNDMYRYLLLCHSQDSSYYDIQANYDFNQSNSSGWIYDNTTLYPLRTSKYSPSCCIVYDSFGGDKIRNNGYMSEFLNLMTKYNNVDNIIDMSIIPNNIMLLTGATMGSNWVFEMRLGVPTFSQPIISKKLYRFPYTYLRAVLPNGDVKEYKYEHFQEMINDGLTGKCDLALTLDITDRPVLLIAPRGYKYSGLSDSSYMDTNILEAIYFDQFPTAAYNIDSFTAQCAAVANATIANRTVDNAADLAAMDVATSDKAWYLGLIEKAANMAAGVIGGSAGAMDSDYGFDAAGGGSMIIGGAASTIGEYGKGAALTASRKKFEAASERWKNASSALREADGGVIGEQLRLSKQSFACDKYFPSNGIGVSNFNELSFCDVVYLKAQLSPEIVDLYDYYFAQYGYQSGRCGYARVWNYISGSSTPSEVPHWITIDNRPTTYVKTMDCKIKYSMIPVASYIKNMFDSGIRLIKGD